MRVRNDDHVVKLSAYPRRCSPGRMWPRVFAMAASRVHDMVAITGEKLFQAVRPGRAVRKVE